MSLSLVDDITPTGKGIVDKKSAVPSPFPRVFLTFW